MQRLRDPVQKEQRPKKDGEEKENGKEKEKKKERGRNSGVPGKGSTTQADGNQLVVTRYVVSVQKQFIVVTVPAKVASSINRKYHQGTERVVDKVQAQKEDQRYQAVLELTEELETKCHALSRLAEKGLEAAQLVWKCTQGAHSIGKCEAAAGAEPVAEPRAAECSTKARGTWQKKKLGQRAGSTTWCAACWLLFGCAVVALLSQFKAYDIGDSVKCTVFAAGMFKHYYQALDAEVHRFHCRQARRVEVELAIWSVAGLRRERRRHSSRGVFDFTESHYFDPSFAQGRAKDGHATRNFDMRSELKLEKERKKQEWNGRENKGVFHHS